MFVPWQILWYVVCRFNSIVTRRKRQRKSRKKKDELPSEWIETIICRMEMKYPGCKRRQIAISDTKKASIELEAIVGAITAESSIKSNKPWNVFTMLRLAAVPSPFASSMPFWKINARKRVRATCPWKVLALSNVRASCYDWKRKNDKSK